MATTTITVDQGFDETYYLQAKAAQLTASTGTTWTVGQTLAAIEAAGLTPAEHYSLYGYNEGLSPNAYFNADQYAVSKAAEVGGGYTAAQFEIDWYNQSGSANLYLHYIQYGAFEDGVSPSSGFDDAKYYAAKAEQMGGGTTAAEAEAAIKAVGLTAISHYLLYGINENLSYTPTAGGETGQTYTLTTGVDNIMGTSGNDTFNATLGGALSNQLTLNTLDSLDGAGGTDTLNVGLRGSVTPVHLDNIEIITVTGSGALNLTNAGQVTSVGVYGTTGVTTTISGIAADATLAVQDTSSSVEFDYATTTGIQSASLTVNGVTAGAAITIDGIETITTTATGLASNYTLDDNAATTLNFAGSAAQAVTLAGTGTVNVSLFDASSAIGSVNLTTTAQTGVSASTVVTVNGGSGNDTLTVSAINQKLSVSGGAGNDYINIGAIAATDTVVGGDGTDTLGITLASIPTTALTHVSGIEGVQVTDAALNTALTLSKIQAGITTVNLVAGANAGTVTFDSGVAGTVNLSAPNAGTLTVASAGTGTSDAITIASKVTSATDVFNGQAITATGVETLTIDDTTTLTNLQTVGAITATSGTTAIVFTGNNDITTGVIRGGSIDASGLTGTTGLVMGAASVGVTSITGSDGADTLRGQAAASTTINGGAGNDNITGGSKADSITAGDGNDTIISGGGADTLLGGAGDDYFNAMGTSALVSGEVVTGGDGTDTLAIDAVATASTAQGITGIETLSLTAAMTQDMALFLNNTTFNEVDFNAANILVTDAGAGISTLQIGVSGGTDSFTRLTDTSSDALTIKGKSGAGALVETALTVNNEESLAINSGTTAGDSLTITTLNASDLTSLTVTGSNNVRLGSVAGATKLANVDASALTGTFSINASSSTVNATFTGSTTAANTITGGSGNDIITGGSAGDSLSGGVGDDTILGGSGDDALFGGSGADSLLGGVGNDTTTGGTGNDRIDLTTGGADKIVYTTVLDGTDTISGFTAGTGTGADTLSFTMAASGSVVGTISDMTAAGTDLTTGNLAVVYSTDLTNLTGANFSETATTADVLKVTDAQVTVVAFATSTTATTAELYAYDGTANSLTDLGSVAFTGSTTVSTLYQNLTNV